MKTMYELYYHSEFNGEETNVTSCEIRKSKCNDSVKSGDVVFDMYDKFESDVSVAYDSLDEIFDMLTQRDDINISAIHIRKPGEGIKIVAINGEPVTPTEPFEEWTPEELQTLNDFIN